MRTTPMWSDAASPSATQVPCHLQRAFSLSRSAAACLPQALTSAVDGQSYPIDPSFRTVLACLRVLGDPDRDDLQKLLFLAKSFYLRRPPPDAGELFAAFVAGGEAGRSEGPPLVDFEMDAGALYASFWQQYGIDLLTARLHWVAFRELLAGLNEQTPFGARVRLRTTDEGDVPPEARTRLRRMKEKFAIAPRVGCAEQALLTELDQRLAAGENPDDVLSRLRDALSGENDVPTRNTRDIPYKEE
ncbi:MAG: bacteriophage Gp15 family protein [Eubacteriales bacterium]|nr:bacteriophage Gp15 family protein [Eubacteriales bacterium]